MKDNKFNQYFPDEFYSKLPAPLNQLTGLSNGQRRQRDVIAASLILILSGCYQKVYGRYAGKKVYPNLLGIIGGPPASGKGAMLLPKLIGDKIHLKLEKENEKNWADYKENLLQWQTHESGPKPEQPKLKLFFLPGNITAAGIVKLLSQNESKGVIVETEADTIIHSWGQKVGDYSDLLRKVFHHERVSSFRKTKSEYISMDSPALSMLLSGTPEQLTGLIKGAENGLFSRLIFYVFDDEPMFYNPFAPEHTQTVSKFEEFGGQVSQYFFQALNQEEREFRLQSHQEEKFNEQFKPLIGEFYKQLGNEAVSIPMRQALILFRIAMILTVTRNMNNGEELICDDRDFEAATMMVRTFQDHSLAVYNALPEKKETKKWQLSDQQLLDCLPDEFDTALAHSKWAPAGFSTRTTFRRLQRMQHNGDIVQIRLGWYRKVKKGG